MSAAGQGRRPRARRVAATVALIAWVCLIWGNSLVPGEGSSRVSGLVVDVLGPLLSSLGLTDPAAQTFLVRKCAHFLEYAVLGVLALCCARAWGLSGGRALALVALACVAVPLADEGIQLHVPGRAGSLRDVGIDVSGAATGLLASWLVLRARLGVRGRVGA